jgi:phage terminase small subunit
MADVEDRTRRRRSSRRTVEERERLFAAAYVKLQGDGIEAAKAAGYRGARSTLKVTACRLLGRASVRAILDKHGQAVEERMGMSVPDILDRLAMQATASLAPFLRLVDPSPEDAKAAIEACKGDQVRAARVLAMISRGPGFDVDVKAGLKVGKGDTLKKLTVEQTADGADKVTIEVRDPMPALALLAKIRGLTNDQPPPPPRQSVTLNLVLASLPMAILDALDEALEAAAAKRRAIPAEVVVAR